jgi:peptide/nickel transport system permease protein
LRIISRRLLFYLVTAVVAVSLDFLIPRLIPGNPVDAILSRMQGVTLTPATIHNLDLQFGVNTHASLWTQYVHYWNNILHGNLGVSSGNGFEPVRNVILAALPYTLGLVGVATVISFLLGTIIGALIAWKHGSWLDNLLPVVTFFQAAPYFFLAFLAIDLFAITLAGSPPAWRTTARTSPRLPGPTSVTCSTTRCSPRSRSWSPRRRAGSSACAT